MTAFFCLQPRPLPMTSIRKQVDQLHGAIFLNAKKWSRNFVDQFHDLTLNVVTKSGLSLPNHNPAFRRVFVVPLFNDNILISRLS